MFNSTARLPSLKLLFLCVLFLKCSNTLDLVGNSSNTTNSTNTTNITVEPHTYCSSVCVDYVDVCWDVLSHNCIVCSSSVFEYVPHTDGSCILLNQH